MGSKDGKDDFSTVPVVAGEERLLSKIEFQRLADVPPEAEWFANLTNENTKRAYRNDVTSFMRFVGITRRNASGRSLKSSTGSSPNTTPDFPVTPPGFSSA